MLRRGTLLLAIVSASLLLSGHAYAAGGAAAKRQLQDLYVNKFDCVGAGAGSTRCRSLERAYAAAGLGDLAADVSVLTLEVVGSRGTLYTVTLPESRLTLTFCNIPADGVSMALWGLSEVEDVPEFQSPQLPVVDQQRCATFTAPFTTRLYSPPAPQPTEITVETFGARTWMFDVRRSDSLSIEGGTFTVP
jgi:hypothetical protein